MGATGTGTRRAAARGWGGAERAEWARGSGATAVIHNRIVYISYSCVLFSLHPILHLVFILCPPPPLFSPLALARALSPACAVPSRALSCLPPRSPRGAPCALARLQSCHMGYRA